MTVKEYNTEVYPKINNSRAFIGALDHAVQKAGPNAEMQVRVIGWNGELKNFIREAIDFYAAHLRSQIE